MGEAVVTNGPKWIEALSQLTPLVAIGLLLVAVVALFVYAQRHDKKSTLDTIKVVSETIVVPLRDSMKESVEGMNVAVAGLQKSVDRNATVIENHFAHDAEDREAHTKAFVELVDCIKTRGVKE